MIQPLTTNGQASEAEPEAGKPAKSAKPAKKKPAKKAGLSRPGGNQVAGSNKKVKLIAMMKRPKGTTLAEVMEATGWQ